MKTYNRTEIVALVDDLTETRLSRYIHLEIIRPVSSDQGDLFRDIDLARLRLICDVAECYQLDDEGLRLVMGLLDQVHSLRGDLRMMLAALAEQPGDLRHNLAEHIRRLRAD